MSSKVKTTPPLRGTPPEEGNYSPSLKGWQAKPDGVVPKLRFPDFRDAEGWTIPKLGSIGIFTGGGTPSKEKADYWTGGNPWISSSDISEDGIQDVSISRFISDEAIQASATKVVPANSILLVSRVGVGKLAISRVPVCTSQDFTNFTPTKDDLVFLAYCIKSLKTKLLAFNQGMAIKGFTKDDVSNLGIPLPQLAEQQKIANCLSSLDDLIAAQARKVDALKTHKKGLMQQLFPREGETQPQLRFPEFRDAGEWEVLPIGDKVELLSGFPFDGPDISQDSTGVPLLRGINVTEGRVRHNAEIDRYFTESVENLEKYTLQLNDLVIGMDGSKVGKNSALITTTDVGALLIQRVARLRTKSVDLIQFIFQQINSSMFHRYVDKINTSSGIPHISAKQIKEFCIAFPSSQEQQRIADCLANFDTFITSATQELATLKSHKKGLMQQLFPSVGGVAGEA